MHGPFEQIAIRHLEGTDGMKCSRIRHSRKMRLSTNDFIAHARAVHGDLYDYSASDYRGSLTPITIICQEHGPFEQTPNNHINDEAGCQECAKDVRRHVLTLGQSGFEDRMREQFSNKYDFSTAIFRNVTTPVVVICAEHGPFERRPLDLMQGQGCRECWRASITLSTEDFIERASLRHEGFYTYEHVIGPRTPTRSRILITCPNHGDWEVVAGEHLRGSGCPPCGASQQERAIAELLERHGIDFVPQWGHPTLRNKRPLRYDFMLPRTRTLIEYDGLFHFQVIQIGGMSREEAVERLRTRQKYDRIKDRWAESNGWKLIRLSNKRRIEQDLCEAGVLPGPRDSA
ncbi:hypothetical protein [Aeromicrobium sp. CTD01-1L150]|uniref:hypothetical protein n=1 Tax=Aeromicrobium sp. CTD01-1L150 TaxID=3341830 RepID=UPI0035C136F0